MTIELIEVKHLSKSPLNVRKTASKAACEELKASLLAHGLMQNLVVIPTKKGKHQVIAGARRLSALQALIEEGKLPADHTVACRIATEEEAKELSLAENTVRAAMHPADEFEAFAALADKGQSAEDIALNFGTTAKHVEQRLKLGRVAPELIAEYRAEKIDLECLMAFTITDDRKRQADLYRSLQGWQKGNARHIRSCLTEQMTCGSDKLAKFVGQDAYKAAGGRIKADLFGDSVFLENTALLQRLAGERLEAEAEKLRQDGWGWVEVDFEVGYGTLSKYGRIQPVPLDAPAELVAELERAKAVQSDLEDEWDAFDGDDEQEHASLRERVAEVEQRLEAAEERLEAYTDFDTEQKKLAGCFVSISYDGKLDIEKGRVKKDDQKKVAKGEDAPEKPAGLPQSLIDDLKAYRTQVAQVALAENPAIAFDLLVFQTAREALTMQPNFDGPDVHFRKSYPKPSGGVKTDAAERLEAIKAGLPLAWAEGDSPDEQFDAFRLLSTEEKHRLLAYCTALTLKPKLAKELPTAYDIALGLTWASVADYWRPTAANFLSRVKSSQLLEIGQEIFGGDFCARWGKAKKSELVAMLDRGFNRADEDRPEIREKLQSWLPEGMAFPKVEAEEMPVKAKKAKKAA